MRRPRVHAGGAQGSRAPAAGSSTAVAMVSSPSAPLRGGPFVKRMNWSFSRVPRRAQERALLSLRTLSKKSGYVQSASVDAAPWRSSFLPIATRANSSSAIRTTAAFRSTERCRLHSRWLSIFGVCKLRGGPSGRGEGVRRRGSEPGQGEQGDHAQLRGIGREQPGRARGACPVRHGRFVEHSTMPLAHSRQSAKLINYEVTSQSRPKSVGRARAFAGGGGAQWRSCFAQWRFGNRLDLASSCSRFWIRARATFSVGTLEPVDTVIGAQKHVKRVAGSTARVEGTRIP